MGALDDELAVRDTRTFMRDGQHGGQESAGD
jgi:hypothetical protein